MIDELKALNDTFYEIFNDLKKARPALMGCDAAFLSIAHKITEQYELEYRLLDLKCRVATEQEIAKLEARYERQVPQRWRTRFFHRRRQNYAMTLTDVEADEEAKQYYTDFMKRIDELAAQMQRLDGQATDGEQASNEIDGEWEIVEEAPKEEKAPENVAAGSEMAAQEASAESAQSEEAPKEEEEPKKKSKRRKGKGKG